MRFRRPPGAGDTSVGPWQLRGAALDQRSGCWQRGREEGKGWSPAEPRAALCPRGEIGAGEVPGGACGCFSPTEKTPRPLKMHPQPNRAAAPSLQPAWLPVVLSDSILGLFLVFTLKNKNKTKQK